jgi:release factor glutamine methyltransferase
MQTLESLLKKGTTILKDNGLEEAGLDAWLLLEFKTGKNRAYYFAHGDEPVSDETAAEYLTLIGRRAGHIPVQQLTHQAFFMGYEFYVNENVLIPRQDTETLVEEALKHLGNVEKPEILDMCTGSGCILLSLLLERQDACGTGVDVSPEALEVAKKNAGILKVENRADFVESDLFSAPYFCEKGGKDSGKYDILISNPPYIATEEIETLMEEVRLHDPRKALDGMEDGLYFYRKITEEAGEYLKPGGWLLYEIGCTQGEAVSEMLRNAGFEKVQVVKDLPGLDRVVMGQKPL